MSENTPTTDEVRETYERARYYLDDMPEEGDSYRAGGGEFDRWITAHDEAIREQVARDLMEKLPRILAETSVDEFGWLSGGLYKDAEADSMDSEVYVHHGVIYFDQIAEYAARIVGGK